MTGCAGLLVTRRAGRHRRLLCCHYSGIQPGRQALPLRVLGVGEVRRTVIQREREMSVSLGADHNPHLSDWQRWIVIQREREMPVSLGEDHNPHQSTTLRWIVIQRELCQVARAMPGGASWG